MKALLCYGQCVHLSRSLGEATVPQVCNALDQPRGRAYAWAYRVKKMPGLASTVNESVGGKS